MRAVESLPLVYTLWLLLLWLPCLLVWLAVPTDAATTHPAAQKARATTATTKATTTLPPQNKNEIDVVSLAASVLNEEREAPLIDDINLLSEILGDIVGTEDPHIHQLYKNFRQFGLERSKVTNNTDTIQATVLRNMVEAASQLTADEAVAVMRTFSIMLNLVNSAEVHHRQRVLQTLLVHPNQTEALPDVDDSVQGTIVELLQKNLASKNEIFDQLCTQNIEIVLTAHPTQVQRKSLLRKYKRISEVLGELEQQSVKNNKYNEYDRQQCLLELKRIVTAIWAADEIRRSKPSVQQEAAGGNALIESVLWEAVPQYLRKLQQTCLSLLGKSLPVDVVPIQFGSWIGGDRDGNPNVTPEITFEVVLQQRLRAARLLTKDLYQLSSELAVSSRFSDEMLQLSDSLSGNIPHKLEKYRRVIHHLIQRLVKTSRKVETELSKITSNEQSAVRFSAVDEQLIAGWQDVEPIEDESDLMKPLKIMYDSLYQTGFGLVADGLLSDIIRRIAVFGLNLVPLDIREESTKHTEALDAITRFLGIGSYKEWNEEARLNWLVAEISSNRPLIADRDIENSAFDESVSKTIRVFKTVASLKPSALGAYVISQAQTASDVLAVMLLQKQYGMTAAKGNMMRVVPLFETLNDLKNAPGVLKTLFSIPVYVGGIKGKQEVMVGYSDSAKDAGRLAACWALYNDQEEMAEVASKFGIELTFFHGKGGTVGRGGNPSVYRAIMSHPPNTINGRFRVTEQGEMIMQNFGTLFTAERTLDIYTAAVCGEAFMDRVTPKASWRQQMEKISEVSCADYRKLVREEPLFVPYFRQATPELELGALNIGSRPAKRKPKGGVESLRAIPWTFAWAQTRSHLSAWMGVGKGLTTTDPNDAAIRREMYQKWPWFRENVDLISMVVSKTDFSINKNYDDQLVSDENKPMGELMRDKLVQTRQSILDVTESTDVSGIHINLQRASSQIRHPYIDPVNCVQAELLKRYRALEGKEKLTKDEKHQKQRLMDGLVLSINAISQGMKNSG